MARKRTRDSMSGDEACSPNHRKEQRRDGFPTITQVVPDGDLRLAVKSHAGKESTVFLVNRSVLCVSSPVFSAMLGKESRFREAQTTLHAAENPTVSIEDPCVYAIKMFLHVIHMQGHLVPEVVSFKHLLHLAIVCDKYDLRRSLRAWPSIWIKFHCRLVSPKPSMMFYSKSLVIASAFKDEDLLSDVTKRLIIDSNCSPAGNLVTPDGDELGDGVSGMLIGLSRLCETVCSQG